MEIVLLIPFFIVALGLYSFRMRRWIRLGNNPADRLAILLINGIVAAFYTACFVALFLLEGPYVRTDGFVDPGPDFTMELWLVLFLPHLFIVFMVVEIGMMNYEQTANPKNFHS